MGQGLGTRHLVWTSAVLTLAMLAPQGAQAHIRLLSPLSRYGDQQKTGPCGVAGGARTENVAVFEPGATITVEWEEYINHPSHYRISFDIDGDDDFVDPATPTDFFNSATVLIDDIDDPPEAVKTMQVTLPNIECENCTLQVIQAMYDKPPFASGNDIYYQCVDIALRSGGAVTPPPGGGDSDGTVTPPPGVGDSDGTASPSDCSLGGQPVWIATWLTALLLLRFRRRLRNEHIHHRL